MSMHLVRGLSSINTKKRRKNKAAGWKSATDKHEAWLKKMGVHPSQLKEQHKSSGAQLPDYKQSSSSVPTSDVVCKIAGKKKQNVYTGDEIVGFGQLHKSNMVPIRKDNKEAAKEIARMRRG
jgi:hypothetical protein